MNIAEVHGEEYYNYLCGYDQVSKHLQVQWMCMQTMPCQHYVMINDKSELWYGDQNLLSLPDPRLNYEKWCNMHPSREQINTNDHDIVYINEKNPN